ncbi:MAG: sigma 54-interacting transcriptional regulator [bacterium]
MEPIIITGAGGAEAAQVALKSGAWDFIQKPASVSELELSLIRALQYRELKQADLALEAIRVDGIVGQCPAFIRCLQQAARAATSDVTVLITGETGTGKELVARAIHAKSFRAQAQFVVVDCTVIPQNLVESTLFGQVRGAFTGAEKESKGLVGQAHGGTLFLDEVGELDISVQKAFLRVLQEKKYRQVGGREELESDFRLVAATNRDLEALVKQGRFRQDLLHRLMALHIHLPPLRDRGDDIKALVM